MRFNYCLILLLLAGSVRIVSMEQRRNVLQLADKTENFSASPEKIWIELAVIREPRGVCCANDLLCFYREVERILALTSQIKHNMKG